MPSPTAARSVASLHRHLHRSARAEYSDVGGSGSIRGARHRRRHPRRSVRSPGRPSAGPSLASGVRSRWCRWPASRAASRAASPAGGVGELPSVASFSERSATVVVVLSITYPSSGEARPHACRPTDRSNHDEYALTLSQLHRLEDSEEIFCAGCVSIRDGQALTNRRAADRSDRSGHASATRSAKSSFQWSSVPSGRSRTRSGDSASTAPGS